MRIDQYQGADAVGLEEKIKQHLEMTLEAMRTQTFPRAIWI